MRTCVALCVSLVLMVSASAVRAAAWQPAAGHVQIPIWPGVAPDAVPNPEPETVGPPAGQEWWSMVSNVSRPTITV